jgi:hypothetical protein
MSNIQFAGHRTVTSSGDALAVTIPTDVASEKGLDLEDAGDHQVFVQYDEDTDEISIDLSSV